MNDRLPLEGVLPMHCSANVDDDGRVAVFFGLSGTGKTTLSADPERHLIGDDEHGWSDDGIFNFEGGCYAKVIRLSAEAEPEIYATTRAFGTVLENVVMDERGVLDLDDDSKTENTRAAYKLEQIANALPAKRGGHPSSVVFLTADAFGILPPIARLTPRPGAVLVPLRLHREARRHRDRRHRAAADVLGVLRRAVPAAAAVGLRAACSARSSTQHDGDGLARQHGLDGRPVRRGRADADHRRRATLLDAALSGELDGVEYRVDPTFGLEVPVAVPGVDPALLDPRSTWADPDAYDAKAARARRACSARTSRASTTSRPASQPPARPDLRRHASAAPRSRSGC